MERRIQGHEPCSCGHLAEMSGHAPRRATKHENERLWSGGADPLVRGRRPRRPFWTSARSRKMFFPINSQLPGGPPHQSFVAIFEVEVNDQPQRRFFSGRAKKPASNAQSPTLAGTYTNASRKATKYRTGPNRYCRVMNATASRSCPRASSRPRWDA